MHAARQSTIWILTVGLLALASAGCDDETSTTTDGPAATVDLSPATDGTDADAGADQGNDGPLPDGPRAEAPVPDSHPEGTAADTAQVDSAVPDVQVADGPVSLEPGPVVKLWFGTVDTTAKTIEVHIDSPFDVSAFGFELTNISLTSAAGGLAASSGFTVVVGPTKVSGFSASSYINAPQGVLTIVTYSAASGSVCIQNPIIADPSAKTLPVSVGSCISP